MWFREVRLPFLVGRIMKSGEVKSNRKANSCSGDEQPRNRETLFSETHNHSILTSFPASYHCLRESTLREIHSWSFTLTCFPFQLHWAWCLNSSSLKWLLLPLQRHILKHRNSYNLQDRSSMAIFALVPIAPQVYTRSHPDVRTQTSAVRP